jgi:hypothetical protein
MRAPATTLAHHGHDAARRAAFVALALVATLLLALIGILANATVLAVTACAAPAVERYLSSSERIELCEVAGRVRVVGGPGTRAEIYVTRGGRDGARLRVEQEERGGVFHLRVLTPERRVVYPRMHGGRTGFELTADGCFPEHRGLGLGLHRVTVTGSGSGLEAWADVEVRVPRARATAIHLGVGEVVARDVEGDVNLDVASASIQTGGTRGGLRVDMGSGEVVVHGHRGPLDVDTGSGHVEAEDVHGGPLKFDTGSGVVTARNVESDDLLVDTGSGAVDLDSLRCGRISVDTGSGGVRISLLGAPGRMLVDTGSGGVTIVGPEDLDAAVELDTGSGGIATDYTMTVSHKEQGSLHGTIGGGHGHIKVDTGSGGVSLRRR